MLIKHMICIVGLLGCLINIEAMNKEKFTYQTRTDTQDPKTRIKFSNDGKLLAVGGCDLNNKAVINIHQTDEEYSLVKTLKLKCTYVYGIDFPTEKMVIACSELKSDEKDLSCEYLENSNSIICMASRYKIYLKAQDRDTKMSCWDIESGKCIFNKNSDLSQIKVWPKKESLFIADGLYALKIWDIDKQDIIKTIPCADLVSFIAFNPDDSDEGLVELWDEKNNAYKIAIVNLNIQLDDKDKTRIIKEQLGYINPIYLAASKKIVAVKVNSETGDSKGMALFDYALNKYKESKFECMGLVADPSGNIFAGSVDGMLYVFSGDDMGLKFWYSCNDLEAYSLSSKGRIAYSTKIDENESELCVHEGQNEVFKTITDEYVTWIEGNPCKEEFALRYLPGKKIGILKAIEEGKNCLLN